MAASQPVEAAGFTPGLWERSLPILSASAGLIITCVWFYTICGKDPASSREKLRGLKRRRGEHCALALAPDGSLDQRDHIWRERLPAARYAALRKRITDPANLPPEDGGIFGITDDGVFLCAGCKTPLYDNDARFEAGAGWPCFYTCLPGAVRERADADGVRMELVCNACNGHLGHIFRGENWGFPPPDERHCVNSLSLLFVKKEGATSNSEDERLSEEGSACAESTGGSQFGDEDEEFERHHVKESGYDKWLRYRAELAEQR
ncbi:hypothetical protein AB1Y20_020416 [Prymnesium parvum]|uniref:MsrB domain-containing protein n=1 Tax=Prymnesium parvum TaxID=97485 RepID=A0AB34JUL1_PRYPA